MRKIFLIVLLFLASEVQSKYIYSFRKHFNPDLVSTEAFETITSTRFCGSIDEQKIVFEMERKLTETEYKAILNEVHKYGYYAEQEKAFASTGTTITMIDYVPMEVEKLDDEKLVIIADDTYEVIGTTPVVGGSTSLVTGTSYYFDGSTVPVVVGEKTSTGFWALVGGGIATFFSGVWVFLRKKLKGE